VPKDAQYVITRSEDGLVVAPLEGDAPLVFTALPADAELLADGKLDLAVAFMQGRVKAAGDGKALLALLKNHS
jgi:hypothetical protein